MANTVPVNTVVIGKKSFSVRFDVGAKSGALNMLRNLNGGNYFRAFPQMINPAYDEAEIISLVASGYICAARLNGMTIFSGADASKAAIEEVEAAWAAFKDELREFAEGLPTDEGAIAYVVAEKQKVMDQIADAIRYDEGFPKRKPKGMKKDLAVQLGQNPGT